MSTLDHRVCSSQVKFHELLAGPLAGFWLWAIGQLFCGHLKLQTSEDKTEDWPIYHQTEKVGSQDLMLGTRLFPIDLYVERISHLAKCLVDEKYGVDCRRLFKFFLDELWVIHFPKEGNFSLVAPRDLDFFRRAELSDFLVILDQARFRPLTKEEMVPCSIGRGHRILTEDGIFIVDIDVDGLGYEILVRSETQSFSQVYNSDPVAVAIK
jgi:hypothetical protein